jgi:hypothetical protein
MQHNLFLSVGDGLQKLCNKLADVPTPAGPTPREIEASIRNKLPLLSAAVEK